MAAGVSGGECTVDVGGECRGDASVDPEGKNLRLGVVVPDGTLETGCEPGSEIGSNAWCCIREDCMLF